MTNTVDGLLGLLRDAAEDVLTVVLVGHNPAVARIAGDLDDGAARKPAQAALSAGFAPATVAIFDIGTPFTELGPGGASLAQIAVPGG